MILVLESWRLRLWMSWVLMMMLQSILLHHCHALEHCSCLCWLVTQGILDSWTQEDEIVLVMETWVLEVVSLAHCRHCWCWNKQTNEIVLDVVEYKLFNVPEYHDVWTYPTLTLLPDTLLGLGMWLILEECLLDCLWCGGGCLVMGMWDWWWNVTPAQIMIKESQESGTSSFPLSWPITPHNNFHNHSKKWTFWNQIEFHSNLANVNWNQNDQCETVRVVSWDWHSLHYLNLQKIKLKQSLMND